MWKNFKHIAIHPENIGILGGNVANQQTESDTFEEKIKAIDGIELFVGGISPDGHIAFSELVSSLVSRTHVPMLDISTILARAGFFNGDLAKVPTVAQTVGVGTVVAAREVMIPVTSAHRAFVRSHQGGRVNHVWTVSRLPSSSIPTA